MFGTVYVSQILFLGPMCFANLSRNAHLLVSMCRFVFFCLSFGTMSLLWILFWRWDYQGNSRSQLHNHHLLMQITNAPLPLQFDAKLQKTSWHLVDLKNVIFVTAYTVAQHKTSIQPVSWENLVILECTECLESSLLKQFFHKCLWNSELKKTDSLQQYLH